MRCMSAGRTNRNTIGDEDEVDQGCNPQRPTCSRITRSENITSTTNHQRPTQNGMCIMESRIAVLRCMCGGIEDSRHRITAVGGNNQGMPEKIADC